MLLTRPRPAHAVALAHGHSAPSLEPRAASEILWEATSGNGQWRGDERERPNAAMPIRIDLWSDVEHMSAYLDLGLGFDTLGRGSPEPADRRSGGRLWAHGPSG
jgi:hypothetical protein